MELQKTCTHHDQAGLGPTRANTARLDSQHGKLNIYYTEGIQSTLLATILSCFLRVGIDLRLSATSDEKNFATAILTEGR